MSCRGGMTSLRHTDRITSMKIGIVGSRKFPELHLVTRLIESFPSSSSIISGGAKGVDTTAIQAARDCRLSTQEYLPETSGCTQQYEYTRAYYTRNQQIVDAVDVLYAFTEKDTGGTWDSIKRARRKGIPVHVIRPETHIPNPGKQHVREKGKGPFHLKRVGFGSAALHLKKYFSPVEWADYVLSKAESPDACAARMLPDFLGFLKEHGNGCIHVLTQAPKSLRHLDAPHPMDSVCASLTQALGIPYVPMFMPWDKPHRGRCIIPPPLTCLPAVREYRDKVVYVLDDVTTTNTTLRTAVQALMAYGIHTHAIAWVRY